MSTGPLISNHMSFPHVKLLIIVKSCNRYSAAGGYGPIRRRDIRATWGADALAHPDVDLMFVVGDASEEHYDEKTHTLHVTQSDAYTYGINDKRAAPLFEKTTAMARWVVKNRTFDWVYLCDDDVYVNVDNSVALEPPHDVLCTGSFGGAGWWFRQAGMEQLSRCVNWKLIPKEDLSIYNYVVFERKATGEDDPGNPALQTRASNENNAAFYTPGENLCSFHYAAGHRMRHHHRCVQRLRDTGRTGRRVVLWSGLRWGEFSDHVTDFVRNTRDNSGQMQQEMRETYRRFYSFTTDPNGWEYVGGYARSDIPMNTAMRRWPFVDRSMDAMCINWDVFEQASNLKQIREWTNEQAIWEVHERCERCCWNPDHVFFHSDSPDHEIEGYVHDDRLHELIGLDWEHMADRYLYRRASFDPERFEQNIKDDQLATGQTQAS